MIVCRIQGADKHVASPSKKKPTAKQPKADTAATQQHLSSHAAEQLLAHGVPQHVLTSVQAALLAAPRDARQQNGKQQHSGYVRKAKQTKRQPARVQADAPANCAPLAPFQSSKAQADPQALCQPTDSCQSPRQLAAATASSEPSSSDAVRSGALALEARMDSTLQRITNLEEPAAQSGSAPSLHWEPLNLKLQVTAFTVYVTRLHCVCVTSPWA